MSKSHIHRTIYLLTFVAVLIPDRGGSPETHEQPRSRMEKFSLTITIKKANIITQDVSKIPKICTGDHTLEVVGEFAYLGSTISSNASLDTELNKRVGKAAKALSRVCGKPQC